MISIRRKQGSPRHGSRADRLPMFVQLEQQARRLQVYLILLLVSIALLSTGVFLFLELGRLRADARRYARNCALLITSGTEPRELDIDRLTAQLQFEMDVHQLVFVRLVGEGGQEILRLGEPSRSLLPNRERLRFPPSAPMLQELEVETDIRSIPPRLVRVFGIHLSAAFLLAVGIYRLPVRALHRAIDELESTYSQLLHSERLSALGEIYASLTHEINNPLGIILSRVNLMMAAAHQHQPRKNLIRDLEMIERHGNRIAEIIRSLLAFVRKTSFQLVETDLNRLIDEVARLVERTFRKNEILIQRFFQPSLPPLKASPPHLQQVFLNLLNNARDAMPEGGTITLQTFLNGHDLVAEVRDTGTGIAKDLHGRLFEPFFTTKEVGKGTGLGLSVSYGIVKAHGGVLEVESVPNQGTTFRVKIPWEKTGP